jgi:small subunit ribosomal protein S4
VVFRSGVVNTLSFARQLVSHGHTLVDGKKVTIPSFQLKPGQTVSLKKEKMIENKLIKDSLAQNTKIPSFLDFKRKETEININFSRYPTPEELEKGIDTSLVIE